MYPPRRPKAVHEKGGGSHREPNAPSWRAIDATSTNRASSSRPRVIKSKAAPGSVPLGSGTSVSTSVRVYGRSSHRCNARQSVPRPQERPRVQGLTSYSVPSAPCVEQARAAHQARNDFRDQPGDEYVLRLRALLGQCGQYSGEAFTGRARRVVEAERRTVRAHRLLQRTQTVRGLLQRTQTVRGLLQRTQTVRGDAVPSPVRVGQTTVPAPPNQRPLNRSVSAPS